MKGALNKMDIQLILTAISSVGFPIVACGAMAYFFAKTNQNYRDDLKEQNQLHKEETKSLVDAINNNSMVIQRLIDKLDKE